MRFFSEIMRNKFEKQDFNESLKIEYSYLFDVSNDETIIDDLNIGQTSHNGNRAYGLFNSGFLDETMRDAIAMSPRPEDLLKELSWKERASKYEIVIKDLVYKKLLRPGSGVPLNTSPIHELAIQFHCNIFIPGVTDPIISTYGFRNAPTVPVKRLIRGFICSINSMTSYECSQFLISSQLLFGSVGNCHFPPDTDLIIIIDIQDVATSPNYKFNNFLPPFMRKNIDPDMAFKYAKQTFYDGQKALKDLQYQEAIDLFIKAKFYCERVVRKDEYEMTFQFDSLNASIYMSLASTYFKLEDFHNCIRFLKIMRKYLHHELYAVLYLEGCAYERIGSFKRALNCFKNCLKVYPTKLATEAFHRLAVKVDVIKLNTF